MALCADFNRLAQLTNLRNLLLRADDQTPEMSVNDIRELVPLPLVKINKHWNPVLQCNVAKMACRCNVAGHSLPDRSQKTKINKFFR